MATVAWAGAIDASATGQPDPIYPASGITAGDAIFALCATKAASGTGDPPELINPASGWTQLASWVGGAADSAASDLGKVRLQLLRRNADAAGTENGTTVTNIISVNTGSSQAAAVLFGVRKGTGSQGLQVALATGRDDTNGTAFSATMTTDPGIVTNDLLVGLLANPADTTTFTGTTIRATGATIGTDTSHLNAGTSIGNDLRLQIMSSVCSAGTATAAPVVASTLSTALSGPAGVLRVRDTTAATPAATNSIVGAVSATGTTVTVKVSDATSARLAVSTASNMASPVYGAAVNPATAASPDGYVKLSITGLAANTTYYYAPALTDSNSVEALATGGRGQFKTFPSGQSGFTFTAASCKSGSVANFNETGSGNQNDAITLEWIKNYAPTFHLFTGDLFYLPDTYVGTDPAALRTEYDQFFAGTRLAALLKDVPTDYIPDDHDLGENNSNSTTTTLASGAPHTAYRQRWPHYTLPAANASGPKGLYHSFVCGRIRFIVLDCRTYSNQAGATPQDAARYQIGPDQMTWLKNELSAQQTANPGVPCVIVSSVPWNEAEANSEDSWGGHTRERDEIANYVSTNSLPKPYMVCGDAHMLAADDGTSDPTRSKGFPNVMASPLRQTMSIKGGPYQSQFVNATHTGWCYGRFAVTDTGTQVTIAFEGWGTSLASGSPALADQAMQISMTTVYNTSGGTPLTLADKPSAARSGGGTGATTLELSVADTAGSGRARDGRDDTLQLGLTLADRPTATRSGGTAETLTSLATFTAADRPGSATARGGVPDSLSLGTLLADSPRAARSGLPVETLELQLVTEVPSFGARAGSGGADTLSLDSESTTALTDTAALTDSLDVATSSVRAPGDAVGLSDAAAHVSVAERPQTSSVGLTDALTTNLGLVLTSSVGLQDTTSTTTAGVTNVVLTDAVGVTSAATSTATTVRTASDTVGLTDAATATAVRSATVTDAVGVVDAATTATTSSRAVTDAVGVVDTTSSVTSSAGAATISDAIGVTDGTTQQAVSARAQSSTVGLVDSVVVELSRSVTDTVGIADSVSTARSINITVTDTVAAADVAATTTAAVRTVGDTVGITDDVVRTINVTISDTIGVADSQAVGKAVGVTISDPIGVQDVAAATSVLVREVDDFLTAVDAVLQGALEHFTDVLGLTDTVGYALNDFGLPTVRTLLVVAESRVLVVPAEARTLVLMQN